jgi:hypothetical protein
MACTGANGVDLRPVRSSLSGGAFEAFDPACNKGRSCGQLQRYSPPDTGFAPVMACFVADARALR